MLMFQLLCPANTAIRPTYQDSILLEWDKSRKWNENADRSEIVVKKSCQLPQEEMFRSPSSNWKISEVFIKHQTPLPNAEYCRRPVQWNKCFAENEKHSRWSHEMVRVGAPTPQSNQQLPPTIIHYLTEFIYGSRSVALRIMNYLRIIHNIQSTRLFLSALSQLVAQPGSNEQGQN